MPENEEIVYIKPTSMVPVYENTAVPETRVRGRRTHEPLTVPRYNPFMGFLRARSGVIGKPIQGFPCKTMNH